jgi:hypothetical protein
VTGPPREPDGDRLQILWGCVAARLGPLRAPGGQAVWPKQEEVVTTWPVPTQAGQGRDQSGAVAVTAV